MKEAGAPERRQGLLPAFISEARANLANPSLTMPALLLLVLLTLSNIVILFHAPAQGSRPGWEFFAAAAVRLIGLLVLSVAILRIAARSERRAYRWDGSSFLYAFALLVSIGLSVLLGSLIGQRTDMAGIAIRNIISTLLLTQFAPWMVGMAVAVPLGWDPRRFMRRFANWLPQLLFLNLAVITPMATIHAWVDSRLLRGQIDWFWSAAILDGVLSTAMALIAFGMNVAAYRRALKE